jgi:cytoskeletal protein RodZ
VLTLGAALRERREAMGVTLAEVEVATRIRQKYLSAIESEEWHMLPGEVVGRGFLRNYADYLGLDPQEIMERRRATTDTGMTQALSTTSAGAPLPPEREVDYRPKEVELKDEGDGIQRGEIRLTPILTILAVALAVALGIWGLSAMREPIGEMLVSAQEGVMAFFEPAEEEPESTPIASGVLNEQNVGDAQVAAMAATATASAGVVVLGSGGTPANVVAPSGGGGEQPPPAAAPDNSAAGVVLVPTNTPAQAAIAPPTATAVVEAPTAVVEPPTATPVPPTPIPPTPTEIPPTPTPEVPTETPTPEPTAPPPVVAAACGDARAVISGPGVNQVVSGVTSISGVANHENFQYYKLEFAPGANAGGGFTFFADGRVQIGGGVLGNLDTTVLPNGEYTIRLTVVDQVGNYPPPCDVTVIVQN